MIFRRLPYSKGYHIWECHIILRIPDFLREWFFSIASWIVFLAFFITDLLYPRATRWGCWTGVIWQGTLSHKINVCNINNIYYYIILYIIIEPKHFFQSFFYILRVLLMKCYLKFLNQIVMYAFWTLNPHLINFLYSLIMIHAAVVESDLFGFSIYFYSICTLGLGPGESMIQE